MANPVELGKDGVGKFFKTAPVAASSTCFIIFSLAPSMIASLFAYT